MSNIFENANLKVESHTNSKSKFRKIDLASDTMLANKKLRELQADHYTDAFESSVKQIEDDAIEKQQREAIVEKLVSEKQFETRLIESSDMYKEAYFKDIIFEMYINSLVIDRYFIEENFTNLRDLIDEYITENGGFEMLANANHRVNSALLKRMQGICESLTHDTITELLESRKSCGASCEGEDNIDEFKFVDGSCCDDDPKCKKEKIDKAMTSLDSEEISDLVKKKVLTVIQDEKNREESEAEIKASIEDEIEKQYGEEAEEDDGEAFTKDQEDLHETLNNIVIQQNPVQSGTLFNTLLRTSYKEIIHENVALADTGRQVEEKKDDRAEYYDVDTTIDDEFGKKPSYDDGDEDNVETSEINMDLILTEAIAKYTLMELMYTLKLKDYGNADIAKLTENMLNNEHIGEAVLSEAKDNNPFIETRSKFFKIFNDIKNKVKVDEAKEKLIKLVSDDIDDEQKKYYQGHISVGIKQLETSAEKNPALEKDFNEYIEWMKGDLTDALNGKAKDEDDEKSKEEKEIEEFWSAIL